MKDEFKRQEYQIGEVLSDGWVVGPRSPETGIIMAIEPADTALKGRASWFDGAHQVQLLRSKGHFTARIPTSRELVAIFNEVVQKDNNEASQFSRHSSTAYWSSTLRDVSGAWKMAEVISMVNACKNECPVDEVIDFWRVRCVRDEPNICLRVG